LFIHHFQEYSVNLNQSICTKVSVAAVTLLVAGVLGAESLPLKSVNKAGEVIDAALEAYGGAETVSNLNSLVKKSEYVTFASGQSRKPGKPWDKGHTKNFAAVNFEDQIFVGQNAGQGGGYDFDGGTIINGDASYQLDFRAGTVAPIAEPDFHTQSGPLIRVTPALLVKQLQERRQTSHWLGEVELDGRPHDVITLVMEVGPGLSLYFDQETHLLTRSERVLPPFGQVEYEFSDYHTVDGIPFTRSFNLFVNGDDNLVVKTLSVEVNKPIEQYAAVREGLASLPAVVPDTMSTNEIDEGVFLIGGNATYTLFVEMEDHVVAVGGTQIVPAAIKELRKEIADKPIRYGVLTHHHSDHVPGSAAYAKEGAKIITFKENEEVVRRAMGDENAELQFVEDRLSLSDGERTIEFYDVGPTPHAEQVLIAWLPEEKIIFEADHFPQPGNGSIPPAVPATEAFARALEKLGLDFEIIIGAHSPRQASPADLATALKGTKRVAQSSH
jgi:glyoxylase-like metal-dependent hydrolase (beta-lactamase superfamily II)